MFILKTVLIYLNDKFLELLSSRSLITEFDVNKRYEIRLLSKIQKQTHDGGSNYKKQHYDKISSDDEKLKIRNTLINMLKSEQYSIQKKAIIAYVCADIGVNGALDEINKLKLQTKGPSYEKQMLTSAYEALLRGVTVNELVYGEKK